MEISANPPDEDIAFCDAGNQYAAAWASDDAAAWEATVADGLGVDQEIR